MEGRKEKVVINVANGQKVDLMSATRDWIREVRWSGRYDHCSEDIKHYLWRDETNQLASDQRPVESAKGRSFS